MAAAGAVRKRLMDFPPPTNRDLGVRPSPATQRPCLDTIEGREVYLTCFMPEQCLMGTYSGATTVWYTFFGVQAVSETISPAFNEKFYGTRNEAKKAAEAYALAQAEATRVTVTLRVVLSRGLASNPAWSRKKVTVVQK